jgi:hypothetical protein
MPVTSTPACNGVRQDLRGQGRSIARMAVLCARPPRTLARRLSFPKIPSVGIRAVKQNQGIIRCDARFPPPDWHFHRQPVQAAAAT